MVLGFFCHSLCGSPCRILFSAVYGDDMQQQSQQIGSVDGWRVTRKEQVLQLACRVQAENGFRETCKDQTPKMKDDYVNVGVPEDFSVEKGCFRLAAGDLFPTPKTVVWLARDECAYVLVCEVDENYMLAESILAIISKMVAEYVTSHEQGNAEIMLKSEKMSAIVSQLLPCGQLLFLNHKVQTQLEKQVERILSAK